MSVHYEEEKTIYIVLKQLLEEGGKARREGKSRATKSVVFFAFFRVRLRNFDFRKKWSVLPLAKVVPCDQIDRTVPLLPAALKKGFSSSTKFQ